MVFTWDQEKHLRNLHAELAEHLSGEVPQNERHMHAVVLLEIRQLPCFSIDVLHDPIVMTSQCAHNFIRPSLTNSGNMHDFWCVVRKYMLQEDKEVE